MGAAGLRERLWMSETLLSLPFYWPPLCFSWKLAPKDGPLFGNGAGADVVFMFWRICQQLRFACSLFCKQAREWNGWGWLASARPHGTPWPAVILLRDECVSGSSSVLPSCGFGVLYGRSRKSKIAWGRIREICVILEIGDKGGRRCIREDKRRRNHPHLKKPVNWGNRDFKVTRPLLTEVWTAFHGLEVRGHPSYPVDSPSAVAVT